MRSAFMLTLLLIIFPSFQALAKSGASKTSRKKDPISINIVGAAKSNGVAKYGAGLGYSLNPSLEMSLLLLGGKQDFKTEVTPPNGTLVKSANGLAGLASINARLYLGNSFSVLAGGGYQQIAISSDIANLASNRTSDISLVVENAVANFAIGNQWSFKSCVNFGIDWGMMTLPMTKKVTTSIVSDGLTDEENAELAKSTSKLMTRLGKIKVMSLVVVTLGFRF